MKNLILNSEQTIDESGVLAVQVAPFGDFKGILNSPGGKKKPVVQHLDQGAFDRILNAWTEAGKAEILVDADHDSCDGGSTKAYAWAANLRVEEGRGLVADFRFTESGKTAVENREYRFVSPVFNCDDKGAVIGLSSIALTNKPNLPVSCVLNRETAGTVNVEETKENPAMDKLKALLGLAPDASDADVEAAVKSLQQKLADADAKALKNEAEAVAEENKDKIENRQAFVDLYVKNGKETAMAFLGAMKAPAKVEKPAQTILNSAEGKTPTVRNSAAADVRAEMAALPVGERAAFYKAHASEF